jgi:undecaprenyl-diphosphatase
METTPAVATRISKPIALWPLAAGLLVALLLALLFGWFASEVLEGETEAFDGAVRNYIHALSSPALTTAMKAISFTGKVVFLAGLGFAAALVLAWLRLWRDLRLFLVTMAGEIILELALKATYMRARPEPFFDLPLPVSYSFPSGHALGALCFYGIAAFMIVRHVHGRFVRIAVSAAAAALVGAEVR